MVVDMTKSGTRIALWVAAAIAAVAIASAAIGASVGTGPNALSEADIASQLADDRTTGSTTTGPSTMTPAPTATSTDRVGPGGVGQVLNTTPGTVVAACSAGSVTLTSWSPNPGYRVDDVVRGPAAKASVWFESDTADDVLVVVQCVDGKPKATEHAEVDDHGGDRGGSGSGRDHPEDD
jgi:hypothetical protein